MNRRALNDLLALGEGFTTEFKKAGTFFGFGRHRGSYRGCRRASDPGSDPGSRGPRWDQDGTMFGTKSALCWHQVAELAK